MALNNTKDRFGSLTKFLHWTIFILFVLQFFLVYRQDYFPKGSPEKLQYMLLHESFGFCVLILALFMITWHYVGVRPQMPRDMPTSQIFAAKTVHFLLYLTMLFQPITGFVMSQLGGYKVSLFGWFIFPTLIEKNKEIGHLVFKAHMWDSYVIIALVSMHVLASLYHHFIKKDMILKRMLPFT